MDKIRKVYVYKKIKTTMDKLRKGDIFSMDSVDRKDSISSKDLFLTIGKPKSEKRKGYFAVRAYRLIKASP